MLHYKTVMGGNVSDALIDEIKALFDSSYGVWSQTCPPDPGLAGKPISFPKDRYVEYFRGSSEYEGECDLALCYDNDRLVGEAIYVNKDTYRGKVAIVVQLVVHQEYRRRGIGSTLLYSIWGFSDYYAWGIVTSNPCTVKTLEKATVRNCSVGEIIQNKNFLRKEVLATIRFLNEARDRWVVNPDGDAGESRIRTGFATARLENGDAQRDVESRLGRIGPQDEWLAFVFNSQSIESDANFKNMLDESNLIVRDAYARMDVDNHAWTGKTELEIDEILKMSPVPKSASICDFGAGNGRHLRALRQRGFDNLVGIDFALGDERGPVFPGDCRYWKGLQPFDLVLCLYDVVGSFRSLEDNAAIISNIFDNLKPGGKAVLSVMNIDYGAMRCAATVSDNPDELYRKLRTLKPSTIMADSGEVFDGRYALVNREEGLVYRKEQFDGDDSRLRRELVVVDRRFTRKGIEDLCRSVGFEVVRLGYVRAGFKRPGLFQRIRAARWGKEILLLLSKPDMATLRLRTTTTAHHTTTTTHYN